MEMAAGLGELVAGLEQATLMAKQLPTTSDPSHIQHIYSSLHSAHNRLSLFLSHHHHPHPQPSFLPIIPPPPPQTAAENSVSSAVGGGDDNDVDPMQVGDDEDDGVNEAEQNSKASIDGVEERMRDCFIQNKRPKRPLSPSSAAAEQRGYGNEALGRGYLEAFDPQGTRLRALDLIYQFHG